MVSINYMTMQNVKANATLHETLFIIHPDHGGKVREFVDRFKKIVEDSGGTPSQVEEWGLRDLAYRIEKQTRGYYVILRHHSSGRAVEELERTMKLSDGVLRYLTVRVDKEPQVAPKARETATPEETGKSPEEKPA